MESNDNESREKIESQLNDNWKIAMNQFFLVPMGSVGTVCL